MKRHKTMFALALIVGGCTPSIDTLGYDSRYSPGLVTDCPEGPCGDGPRIDPCWLSGEEASVFIVEATSLESSHHPSDHCPEPAYGMEWSSFEASLVAPVAGPKPDEDIRLDMVSYFRVGPLTEVGQEFLVAARYHASGGWVVLERIGVTTDGSPVPADQPDGIELPTEFGSLVAQIRNARGDDCGSKQPLTRMSEDDFLSRIEPADDSYCD